MAARNATSVRATPPMRGVKGKLAGVDYVYEWRGCKRRRRKPTLAELEGTWAALERSYDGSCEIRRRRGLSPVEPTFYAHAVWDELERRRPADEVAKRRQARKPRTKAPAAKPTALSPTGDIADVFRMFRAELAALGTPEAVAELERRRAKRAAKREARRAA